MNGEPWVDVKLRSEKFAQRALEKTSDAAHAQQVKQLIIDLKEIALGKKASPPGTDTSKMYLDYCVPLFSNRPYTAEELESCKKPNILLWEYFDRKQYYAFDYREDLSELKIRLDELKASARPIPDIYMIGGEYDPEHPKEGAIDAASRLNPHAACIIITNTGDPVYRDRPDISLEILRNCIKHNLGSAELKTVITKASQLG